MSVEWEQRRILSAKRESDVRSEWYRDYARIIHSSAFRRLQSKTQVLGLGESDFYRTRLTHSMEVAQIGVGICLHLQHKYESNEVYRSALPDTDLMNAICLAHDMGHPPFGHGGEVALNVCMRDHDGFEGNGQTLRILSRLEKYTKIHGLNPTRRMMLGVLKYPVAYSAAVNSEFYNEIEAGKPTWLFKSKGQKPPKCYHDSEQDVVDWILEPIDAKDRVNFVAADFPIDKEGVKQTGKHKKPFNKSLDTSIMELADDISYGLHDLEDAISLGMITREKWTEHTDGAESIFSDCGRDASMLADKLFNRESYERKNCIGDLVNIMISNVEIRKSNIPNASDPLIGLNAYLRSEFATLREHLHNLVEKYVIFDVNVQHLEFKGQRVVVELFEVLASDPDRFLPDSVKTRYSEEGNNIRIICDFVAGMTDDYATRLYDKIFSPGKGSIFDRM
jgi:dGTPase